MIAVSCAPSHPSPQSSFAASQSPSTTSRPPPLDLIVLGSGGPGSLSAALLDLFRSIPRRRPKESSSTPAPALLHSPGPIQPLPRSPRSDSTAHPSAYRSHRRTPRPPPRRRRRHTRPNQPSRLRPHRLRPIPLNNPLHRSTLRPPRRLRLSHQFLRPPDDRPNRRQRPTAKPTTNPKRSSPKMGSQSPPSQATITTPPP